MKAKVYKIEYLENGSNVRVAIPEIIEMCEDDIDKMLANKVCPVCLSDVGTMYVMDTQMNQDSLTLILNKVLPNSISAKTLIVEYYGLSEDPNYLTVGLAVQAIRSGRNPEDIIEHEDIFSTLGITTIGLELKTFSFTYGQNVIVMESKMIFAKVEGSNEKIWIVYNKEEGKKQVFYGSVEVDSLEDIDKAGSKIFQFVPDNMQSISINVKSIFSIIGKIDLTEYKHPKPVTAAWINHICNKLNIPEFKVSSGVKDFGISVNKIYETLNKVADANAQYISEKESYFLLTPEFVKRMKLESDGETKTVSASIAIAFMARRNGQIVTAGNSLFNQETLKDGTIWYLAKMRE